MRPCRYCSQPTTCRTAVAVCGGCARMKRECARCKRRYVPAGRWPRCPACGDRPCAVPRQYYPPSALPAREARIERYTERASLRLPLFGGTK